MKKVFAFTFALMLLLGVWGTAAAAAVGYAALLGVGQPGTDAPISDAVNAFQDKYPTLQSSRNSIRLTPLG